MSAPAQWEARVWAAIQRRKTARRAWRLVPAGASLALAAAVLIVLVPNREAPPGLELQIDRTPGSVMRSASASPGDVLRLKGHAPEGQHAELRLYRDGVLMLRCSDSPPCSRTGENLLVEHTLTAVGRYEPILVTSDQPLSAPGAAESGTRRDSDLDQFLEKGIEFVVVPPVNVF